jgi:hypothetical protein
MARTIIVGDVHGCARELDALLENLRFSGEDRLVSVGDLVGKGPRGAQVVRFFREGGHEAVRGNHDEKILAWRRGETKKLPHSHRRDAARMSEADFEWLGSLPLYIELDGAIVVHGGIAPGIALADQDPDVLMNLRSIRPDGSTSVRACEGAPWAQTWPGPALAVFGHDAVRGLQRWPHAIGLDTGCVYGGSLSALVLPERRIESVRAERAYAKRAAVQA